MAKRTVSIDDTTKAQETNQDQTVEKSEPRLILIDTATGGAERRYGSSGGNAKVFDGTGAEVVNLEAIEAGQFAASTIQFETPVFVLPGRYEGLALDSTGLKVDTPTLYVTSAELLKHAKAAYFEIAYDVSGTTAGSFDAILRDVTAAADVATITISYGTSSKRERSADILASLTSGNEVGAQLNVTTAAATGETGDFIDAKLIVVLGIS